MTIMTPTARDASVRGESGITLIEVMVGVALLMVALIPAYATFESSVRHQDGSQRQAELEESADMAMQTMVRELRQAYSGDPAVTAIQAFSGSSVTFTIPNRTTPFRLQRVSYQLNGTTLERHVVESTNTGSAPWTFPSVPSPVPYTPIARGISSPALFSAFAADGNPTTVAGSVRKLQVAFDVDLDPSSAPSPRSYQSAVTLRSTIVNPGV